MEVTGHKILLLLLLLSRFSRVWLCATPQMAAHQAPLSLGFSRQEHWSGLPFPSPMHESEKWKWSRSVVSHGLQPTRLLCPWDFPGKSTGVGCHCLFPPVVLSIFKLLFNHYHHPSAKLFPSCKTKALYPLKKITLYSPFFPDPGNHHSIFCHYHFDCSKYPQKVKSCNI